MKDFLYRFFQGRYGAYGTDRMTRVLLVIAALLLLLSFLTPFGFLYYIAFIILFYCYFRMFSKNIPARYRENEFFVKCTNKFLNIFKRNGKKVSDSEPFQIYNCPNCGHKIRIPKGKGNGETKCPKCGKEFTKDA